MSVGPSNGAWRSDSSSSPKPATPYESSPSAKIAKETLAGVRPSEASSTFSATNQKFITSDSAPTYMRESMHTSAADVDSLPAAMDTAAARVASSSASASVKQDAAAAHATLKKLWNQYVTPVLAGLAVTAAVPLKITAAALDLVFAPIVALARLFVHLTTPRSSSQDKDTQAKDTTALMTLAAYVPVFEFHPRNFVTEFKFYQQLFQGANPQKALQDLAKARLDVIALAMKVHEEGVTAASSSVGHGSPTHYPSM